MPTFVSDTMRNKKFKTACGAVSLAGFIILLGAAGGSDTGTFTIGQSFWTTAAGLALFAIGGYLGGYIK